MYESIHSTHREREPLTFPAWNFGEKFSPEPTPVGGVASLEWSGDFERGGGGGALKVRVARRLESVAGREGSMFLDEERGRGVER